jgi:hypothetical protein
MCSATPSCRASAIRDPVLRYAEFHCPEFRYPESRRVHYPEIHYPELGRGGRAKPCPS